MSTTTRALWSGLLDDAAVFPPGNAPLEVALARQRRHRLQRYAGLIGPLLIPAGSATSLLELLDRLDTQPGQEPVDVGVIGAAGAPSEGAPGGLSRAVDELQRHPRVRLTGAEMPWHPDWRDLGLTVPLALELPRGTSQLVALDDLARESNLGGHTPGVIAKFRTGPTPTWPWPEEAELASVLTLLVSRQIPFKLTGGLHHAVRGRYQVTDEAAGAREENHGLLNVLVATAAAQATGSTRAVTDLLALREGVKLAALAAEWAPSTVAALRNSIISVGCCGVTDPLVELAALGVLEPALFASDDHPGGLP